MDGRSGAESSRRVTRRQLLVGASAIAVSSGSAAALQRRIGPATVTERPERIDQPVRRRWHAETIGTSVEGRPIVMHTNLAERPRFTLVFISAVHGDERGAGTAGQHLITLPMPSGVSCYGIPIANPDGWERGTRNNANDVDLNRNFPWRWRRDDGGREPLGEPETRALASTITAIQPSLVVWIHEPYGYVAAISDQAQPFAVAWASAAGLQVQDGVRQHGGGETWAAETLGCASILVEGATREASSDEVAANVRGFEALLASI